MLKTYFDSIALKKQVSSDIIKYKGSGETLFSSNEPTTQNDSIAQVISHTFHISKYMHKYIHAYQPAIGQRLLMILSSDLGVDQARRSRKRQCFRAVLQKWWTNKHIVARLPGGNKGRVLGKVQNGATRGRDQIKGQSTWGEGESSGD